MGFHDLILALFWVERRLDSIPWRRFSKVEVSQDPLLGTVKLIAEPWDCGPGGYQVGGFPPGWAEWNDTFRDTVRDFWRGAAPASALAMRLSGSGDLFNHAGRKPLVFGKASSPFMMVLLLTIS